MKGWRSRRRKAPPSRCGTQQIILHESGVANTVDPFGGSYAIEDLTARIEREGVGAARSGSTLSADAGGHRSGYIQSRSRMRVPRQLADRFRRRDRRRVNHFADASFLRVTVPPDPDLDVAGGACASRRASRSQDNGARARAVEARLVEPPISSRRSSQPSTHGQPRRDCRHLPRRLRRAQDAALSPRRTARLMADPLLDVEHLSVGFGGSSPAVDDVSFASRRRTLGLVGDRAAGSR